MNIIDIMEAKDYVRVVLFQPTSPGIKGMKRGAGIQNGNSPTAAYDV